MSRAEQLRARAGAIQARDRGLAPVEDPAPTSAPPPRTTPFRQTVDLPPEIHHEFAAWRLDTALRLGRGRLSTQDALAAVVGALLDDEVVARRVRDRLDRSTERDT